MEKWGEKNMEILFLIDDCNTYMKGVDLYDQRMAYYSYPHVHTSTIESLWSKLKVQIKK